MLFILIFEVFNAIGIILYFSLFESNVLNKIFTTPILALDILPELSKTPCGNIIILFLFSNMDITFHLIYVFFPHLNQIMN